MTKLLRPSGIAATLILGMAVFGISYWIHGDHCDKVVAQTLQSPDGKWAATATQEECGGAAGRIYYLVKLKSDEGDATVLDIAPIDSNAFKLQWKDSHNLVIDYPGSTETYTKLDSYKGVEFSYIDTHGLDKNK